MPDQPPPNPHQSPPLAGPHADALAPQPPIQNLNSDITDELTDHLSLSARDLQLAGHTPDEAQKLAHHKFGDVATIRRRLWWIQKGDEIMLRAALAVVLIVLVLTVAALGIGGWQITQTMNELGETLATMNETQRALLANRQQEDRPLAIRGRLYLGDKSKPASYAWVDVHSLPDGKKVDRLMADEDGRFGTSSLEAGHYTLLAKLMPTDAEREIPANSVPDFYAVQSRPISVYPWAKDTTVELDVAMIDFGRVTFELANPFPQVIEIDLPNDELKRKLTLYPALGLAIPSVKGLEVLPIRRLSASQKTDWPVIGTTARQMFDHALIDVSDFNNGQYTVKQPLPIGKPIEFARVPANPSAFSAGQYQAGAYMTFSYSLTEIPSDMAAGMLPAWQIIGESNLTTLPEESRVNFEVIDQRRTHLRITPPGEFEKALREAVAETNGDLKRLEELQRKAFPVRLEVVGQMDLFDDQEWSPEYQTFSGISGYGAPSDGFGGYVNQGGGYGGAR